MRYIKRMLRVIYSRFINIRVALINSTADWNTIFERQTAVRRLSITLHKGEFRHDFS